MVWWGSRRRAAEEPRLLVKMGENMAGVLIKEFMYRSVTSERCLMKIVKYNKLECRTCRSAKVPYSFCDASLVWINCSPLPLHSRRPSVALNGSTYLNAQISSFFTSGSLPSGKGSLKKLMEVL